MILCIGEAVIDMIRSPVSRDEASLKQSSMKQCFIPIPGGCAYNTSIALGRLGVNTAFFGRVSNNFFGEIQIKRLIENNVDTSLLIRCDQNPILAFIKIEEGKDPQYAFYEEGTADRLLSVRELPALSDNINCIVFGSVSIAMEPIGSVIEELVINESKRRVTAFDPNIRPVMIHDKDAYLRRFKKLAGASAIVKISMEDWSNLPLKPDSKPETALDMLCDMGTKLAVITLGAEGAMALLKTNDGNGASRVIRASAQGVPVPKVADTVGAGDSFMGALLAWLEINGKLTHLPDAPHASINSLTETDLKNALEFANKAAAFVCARHGCEPPFMNEI